MAASALIAVTGLAACGGEEPQVQDPEAESPSSSEETTEEPTQETTEEPTEEPTKTEGSAAAGAEGTTAPGTELTFGEQATVEWSYAEETALLKITVASIEKGDPADLDVLDMGDQVAGLTPYYSNVEIEGADDSASKMAYASIDGDFDGLLGDGSEGQSLSIIGDFPPCDSSDFGESFGPGETVTTCVPYLASGESVIESARFSPFEGPYELLDGDPLIWTP